MTNSTHGSIIAFFKLSAAYLDFHDGTFKIGLMNYKLEQTPEGPRWVKQTWNEETEKIDESPLAVGQTISFAPNDFIGDSSVFVFKERPSEIMAHEDGRAYTLEEMLEEIQKRWGIESFSRPLSIIQLVTFWKFSGKMSPLTLIG